MNAGPELRRLLFQEATSDGTTLFESGNKLGQLIASEKTAPPVKNAVFPQLANRYHSDPQNAIAAINAACRGEARMNENLRGVVCLLIEKRLGPDKKAESARIIQRFDRIATKLRPTWERRTIPSRELNGMIAKLQTVEENTTEHLTIFPPLGPSDMLFSDPSLGKVIYKLGLWKKRSLKGENAWDQGGRPQDVYRFISPSIRQASYVWASLFTQACDVSDSNPIEGGGLLPKVAAQRLSELDAEGQLVISAVPPQLCGLPLQVHNPNDPLHGSGFIVAGWPGPLAQGEVQIASIPSTALTVWSGTFYQMYEKGDLPGIQLLRWSDLDVRKLILDTEARIEAEGRLAPRGKDYLGEFADLVRDTPWDVAASARRISLKGHLEVDSQRAGRLKRKRK